MKVLELPIGIKVKVYSNGNIETLNHLKYRKNGRLDNRKGKILKPHSIKHNLCNANIETLKKANIKRSIKIVYNGVKYNSIKEASRQTGVCEWSIKRKGKEVM